MGKEFPEIDERLRGWIDGQRVFFVCTAPSAKDGRINCSPKGHDSLRVLGSRQIVYADIGGSGIETVAHLKENGRISERESLKNWCDAKTDDELLEYRSENNSRSLDGLPGLDIDRKGT